MNENFSTSQAPPVPPVHPVPPVPPVLPVPPKKSRKRLYIILGVAVFVIIGLVKGPGGSSGQGSEESPKWSGTSSELWDMRYANLPAFKAKYEGEFLEVTGVVSGIQEEACVIGSSSSSLEVAVYLDNATLMQLTNGMGIKVRGTLELRRGSTLELHDARIVN